MRKRTALRLCYYLKQKGVIKVDFVSYVLETYGYRYIRSLGKYRVTVRSGGTKIIRHHNCFFQLCRLVYYKTFSIMSRDQGTVVNGSENLQAALTSVKFPIVTLNVRLEPSTAIKKPKPVPRIQRNIEEVLSRIPGDLKKDIDGYVHSSHLTDDLKVQGQVKLGSRPPRETDFDLEFLQFVRYAIDAPEDHAGNVLINQFSFDIEKQKTVRAGSTGSGYVPVVSPPPHTSKRVMEDAAIMVNEQHKISREIPPSLPHPSFLKGEVLKRGKACRVVQMSSQCNYIVDTLSAVSSTKLCTGVAIGCGTSNYGYLRLFMNWFFVYADTVGGNWDEFIAYLELMGGHESDKTGWEATTNECDGIPLLLSEFAAVGSLSVWDQRLYVRAACDYYNPLIALGNKGFFATGRIASGTQRTSWGNSYRHRAMGMSVCDLIEMSGSDCRCVYCTKIKVECQFSELSLRLRRIAMVGGDDYLSVSSGAEQDAEYDRLIDSLYGTVTKTETRPLFHKPDGWDDSRGCEFLRQSFYVEGGHIYRYRRAGRLLAKLTKSSATADESVFHQALVSARYEAGLHPKLQECLAVLGRGLRWSRGSNSADVERYRKRTPQICDLPSHQLLDYNDLVNMQNRICKGVALACLDYVSFRQDRLSLEQRM